MSRAAVFAGAALGGAALTGACDAGTPPKTKSGQPVVKRGAIKGGVTTDDGQRPGGGKVYLRSTNGVISRETSIDANGEYEFLDLPAATYTVHLRAPSPDVPADALVKVEDGTIQQADLILRVYPVQAQPMPYGAPPARWRRV